MEEHDYIELRSDDVKDILGKPPRWIVRWGSIVIATSVLLLGLASYVVKYPDMIQASMVITTAQPPESINSRLSGELKEVLVEDRTQVESGELVAILKSSASLKDIDYLEQLVVNWLDMDETDLTTISPPVNLELGEVQATFSEFLAQLGNYQFERVSSFDKQTLGEIGNEIRRLRQTIKIEKDKLIAAEEDYKIQSEKFEDDRALYSKGVITLRELRESRQTKNGKLRQVKQLEASISTLNLEIEEKLRAMTSIREKTTRTESNQFVRVKDALRLLANDLEQWKEQHLYHAPIDGYVSLPEVGRKSNFVHIGDEIMAVVPNVSDSIIGTVLLPIRGSGKVKEGQKTIIKFESYPYQEYGVVSGRVISKSLLPKDNQYLVKIELANLYNGYIVTNYSKRLRFDQEMQGLAEIITEDRRLIERIFEKFLVAFEDFTDVEMGEPKPVETE